MHKVHDRQIHMNENTCSGMDGTFGRYFRKSRLGMRKTVETVDFVFSMHIKCPPSAYPADPHILTQFILLVSFVFILSLVCTGFLHGNKEQPVGRKREWKSWHEIIISRLWLAIAN